MMAGEFRLGELLVQEGLVTEVQLVDALTRQRLQEKRIALGQILVSQKVLTQGQLDTVLDAFGKRPRLGDVLVRHGAITPQQLEHALASQKKTHGPLGQVLIKLGYVDDPKGVRTIERMLNSAERMQGMISQLLDFARARVAVPFPFPFERDRVLCSSACSRCCSWVRSIFASPMTFPSGSAKSA